MISHRAQSGLNQRHSEQQQQVEDLDPPGAEVAPQEAERVRAAAGVAIVVIGILDGRK